MTLATILTNPQPSTQEPTRTRRLGLTRAERAALRAEHARLNRVYFAVDGADDRWEASGRRKIHEQMAAIEATLAADRDLAGVARC